MPTVADALRKVTAAMQRAIDSGERSTRLDAEDLIQVLLAVADELTRQRGRSWSTSKTATPAAGSATPTC